MARVVGQPGAWKSLQGAALACGVAVASLEAWTALAASAEALAHHPAWPLWTARQAAVAAARHPRWAGWPAGWLCPAANRLPETETAAAWLDRLRSLAQSGLVEGARGELASAAQLRSLPRDWTVVHDWNLRFAETTKFDGAPLQSVQLDHLAVGPAGIFAIETKSWSEEFLRAGEFFDPFAQVQRHGYAVHRLLKRAGLPDRVRNVITFGGAAPLNVRAVGVAAVPTPGLAQFLLAGPPELDGAACRAVVRALRRAAAVTPAVR